MRAATVVPFLLGVLGLGCSGVGGSPPPTWARDVHERHSIPIPDVIVAQAEPELAPPGLPSLLPPLTRRAPDPPEQEPSWMFLPPTIFGAIFDTTKQSLFTVSGTGELSHKVSSDVCQVYNSAQFANAQAGCLSCGPMSDQAPVMQNLCFVVTPAGLWRVDNAPTVEMELVTAITRAPDVPTSLEPYVRERMQTERVVVRGAPSSHAGKTGYCVTETTDSEQAKGPVEVRWCIAEGVGVTSRAEKSTSETLRYSTVSRLATRRPAPVDTCG